MDKGHERATKRRGCPEDWQAIWVDSQNSCLSEKDTCYCVNVLDQQEITRLSKSGRWQEWRNVHSGLRGCRPTTMESMVYLSITQSGKWTRKYNPRAISHTCSHGDEDSEMSSWGDKSPSQQNQIHLRVDGSQRRHLETRGTMWMTPNTGWGMKYFRTRHRTMCITEENW